jgi:hypothetical protein
MCFGWVGALESQTPSEWLTAQLAGYRLISSNQYHSAILVAGQVSQVGISRLLCDRFVPYTCRAEPDTLSVLVLVDAGLALV